MSYHLGFVADNADPLALVASGAMNIKVNMTGPVVDKAKQLMTLVGYKMSPSIGWQPTDEVAVRSFQNSAGLPISSTFDAATYRMVLSLTGAQTTGPASQGNTTAEALLAQARADAAARAAAGSGGGGTAPLPSWALPAAIGVGFLLLRKVF